MLGVYDYTVVLTYVSLMVSVGGMMFAVNGHLHLGVMVREPLQIYPKNLSLHVDGQS